MLSTNILFVLFGCALCKPNVSFDQSALKIKHKIINGIETDISQVPFIVSLLIQEENSKMKHHCGATILTNSIVISAAHCTHGIGDPEKLFIHAGSTYYGDLNKGQIINVEKIIEHPDYTVTIVPLNDIVLLKLKKPLIFNNIVSPLQFSESEPKEYETATACGWGSTGLYNKTSSTGLLCTKVTTLSSQFCESIDLYLPKCHICAGDKIGYTSTFHGDSGGPLVVNNKLVGLTSYGPPYGMPKAVAYTNVAYFNEWIKTEMSKL